MKEENMTMAKPVQNQISRTSPLARRVVGGFRTPDDRPPTPNELAWLECLCTIVGDTDPPPSLVAVQALRLALMAV